jgi:hypothetical protein
MMRIETVLIILSSLSSVSLKMLSSTEDGTIDGTLEGSMDGMYTTKGTFSVLWGSKVLESLVTQLEALLTSFNISLG